MEIKIHKEATKYKPKEIFCKNCLQLRLNFIGAKRCGNCSSADIIIGEVGSLDKQKLIRALTKGGEQDGINS